jgi:hypothetical protein
MMSGSGKKIERELARTEDRRKKVDNFLLVGFELCQIVCALNKLVHAAISIFCSSSPRLISFL